MVFVYIILAAIAIGVYFYLRQAGEKVCKANSTTCDTATRNSRSAPSSSCHRGSRRSSYIKSKKPLSELQQPDYFAQFVTSEAYKEGKTSPAASKEPSASPASASVPPQESNGFPLLVSLAERPSAPAALSPVKVPSSSAPGPNFHQTLASDDLPVDKTQRGQIIESTQPETDVATARQLNDESTRGVVTAQLISEGETKDIKTASTIPEVGSTMLITPSILITPAARPSLVDNPPSTAPSTSAPITTSDTKTTDTKDERKKNKKRNKKKRMKEGSKDMKRMMSGSKKDKKIKKSKSKSVGGSSTK